MERLFKMFLNPQILSMLIIDIIFLIFSTIAFILSLKIYLKWDFNSTKQSQYILEKQSFLAAVIIKYIFILKLPLFLFFIYTLDLLSNSIIGAMCGAGVIDAVSFGISLFVLKIANMFLFGFWLIIHYEDLKYSNLVFTKLKFTYFILIYFLFISELILEIIMFNSIDISKMVSCCGTLYSSSSTTMMSILFNIDSHIILYIFYFIYLLNLIFYKLKNAFLFSISNILFIPISIISLIVFFSPYIYQLPTHHCPFCILQKDYFYMGYFIYIILFIGTFYGISNVILKLLNNNENKYFDISIIFISLYVFILSAYPILYYINNNVWLN